MPDLCFDRNPSNRGMTCSLPAGHDGDHRFDDNQGAGTWPQHDEEETRG